MKKIYAKNETNFAILWIILYCVLFSVGDNLSDAFGIEKIATFPIALLLSIILLLFVKKNGLSEKYGLCKPKVPASKMLFYIPIMIIITMNLWYGVALSLSPLETVLYILTMFCVGFLEEMIFRGFLFKSMLKDNPTPAIIISSVTFGIGHIVNLFNGSGAELLPNILQVIYAMGFGFMCVMIFHKSGSIIPCIVVHSLFNAMSAFVDVGDLTMEKRIISCAILTVLSGSYALYIALRFKEKKNIENANA